MTFAEAVRLIALQLVVNNQKRSPEELDPDYQLRRIFRWYSKAFHTPLHVVETLPLYDVLQSYWEEQYEGLDEKDLEAERLALSEDGETLEARQREEDEDDLETFLIGREEAAKQLDQAKENAVRKLEDAAAALKGLSGRPIRPDRDAELVMTPVSKLKETPADIHITFADDLDLDADPMTFGLLEPPTSKAR